MEAFEALVVGAKARARRVESAGQRPAPSPRRRPARAPGPLWSTLALQAGAAVAAATPARDQSGVGTGRDFEIRGLYGGRSRKLRTVFFEHGKHALSDLAGLKILAHVLLVPPGAKVEFHGWASGDEPNQAALINRRIAAVSGALRARIPSLSNAQIVPKPHPGARDRRSTYRRWRAVEIKVVPPGTTARQPPGSCVGQPKVVSPSTRPDLKFRPIHSRALSLIDNAQQRILSYLASSLGAALFGHAPGSPYVEVLLDSLFGGVSPLSLLTELGKLRARVAELYQLSVPAGPTAQGLYRLSVRLGLLGKHRVVFATRCHPECLGGSAGVSMAGGEIVLCPTGIKGVKPATAGAAGSAPASVAGLLIHEASHTLGTDDVAYQWNHLMRHLGRASLRNAENYEVLIELLGKHPAGTALDARAQLRKRIPPEYQSVLLPAPRVARAAMAQAERWAESAASDVESLFQDAVDNKRIDEAYNRATLAKLIQLFNQPRSLAGFGRVLGQMQHWTTPKLLAVRLAGIRYRYRRLWWRLRTTKSLGYLPFGFAGVVAGRGAYLFGPRFFASSMSAEQRVKMVLRATAAHEPLIRAALIGAYVDFANHVRASDGIPP